MTGLILLAFTTVSRAEFVLNWSQDTAFPTFSGTNIIHGSSVIQNQTPFVYERVISSEGIPFYHMIIGNPDAGFAQETYIQAMPSNVGNFLGAIGPESSASGGATGGGSSPTSSNAADPLDATVLGGNGSGNPERVQMRQILKDGELTMEFLKQGFSGKPVISHTIDSERHNAVFIIDGSELTYDDRDTAAQITNTLWILDPDIPVESSRFDVDIDAQQTFVTAGRYEYIAGPGFGGSRGSYEYFGGGVNPAPDWSSFFDFREANPWSYPENRPSSPP